MNKKTILGLLIIANLYGQMASANEVIISQDRLQAITQQELKIMAKNGAIKKNGDTVILDLQKLDTMLKDNKTVSELQKAADLQNARSVPYGHTPVEPFDKALERSKKIADQLSSRFIPYGYT
jgi:predicted GTPase